MIRIAKGLELADDIATQSIAILARRGAGKTYTASVLVEEVVKAKIPVVVLDPTGAWWGLRTSADGERPGLPVVIFGGDHADVPLESTAGKVVADVVIEHPRAYVVDLSAFESKGQEIRFAADFLERLYRAKKRETGPLLVVVDEADLFAPQRPGPEQTRTLGALEAIVRRGRIKGLGDLLITQRAAVLNKNVLTQTEVLVVMQTTGPQDRAAIDEWIAGNGTRAQRDEVLDSLASLERGEAWVWSPQFLRDLRRVRIRERTTFDSSRTPESGEVAVTPRAFAKVDLEELGERIRATIEQQKANDPAELRRRIVALERQLAERPAEKVVETVIERVEVPVLNGQVTQLEQLFTAMQPVWDLVHDSAFGITEAVQSIQEVRSDILAAIGRVHAAPAIADRPATARPRETPGQRVSGGRLPAADEPRQPPRRDAGAASDQLGRAERALLTALIQFPDGLTKPRLSFVAGYSHTSSSFSNALGALRSAGLVERSGSPIRATAAGLQALPAVPAPPTREERLAFWGSRLGKAERTFLEVLAEAYPDSLTKEELSERTGYSGTSSSFSNALGRLRSLELVVGFAASPELMD